jgi:hypothetical protein
MCLVLKKNQFLFQKIKKKLKKKKIKIIMQLFSADAIVFSKRNQVLTKSFYVVIPWISTWTKPETDFG